LHFPSATAKLDHHEAHKDETMMHARLLVTALALSAMSSAAGAAELGRVSRGEPVRAFSRLASHGIGYSVLYQDPSAPAGPYRIKVVCRVGQVSAAAYCPTASYLAYCPDALITCH
jgi:hypothetical protein